MQPSPVIQLPQTVKRYSEADVPTEYGTLRVIVYRNVDNDEEHVALVKGDVAGADDLPVRVHSECFTGEVLHSFKCDCREQLDLALRRIADEGRGAVVYLRQEGRGIGLGNKIRAYALQSRGLDTVDANRALGFGDDLRKYHDAADILADLGVRSIALMTNNPAKIDALRDEGVAISRRLPILVDPNPHSQGYLVTKRVRMGHLADEEREDLEVSHGDRGPRVLRRSGSSGLDAE